LLALTASQAFGQDDEEKAERLARSQRIMGENCLICHSEELVTTQRLTPAQWKAEVTKMIGWGSPLLEEEVEGLIAYLAETFPATRPKATPTRVAPEKIAAELRQVAPPKAGGSTLRLGSMLFAQHCATCHAADAKGGDLGQNLVGLPSLLRTEDSVEVIRTGRRRMPGFVAVLDDAQARAIVAWLVSVP
jgi:mono/diheme cytochrome c family protein